MAQQLSLFSLDETNKDTTSWLCEVDGDKDTEVLPDPVRWPTPEDCAVSVLTDITEWTPGTGLEKHRTLIEGSLFDWLGYQCPQDFDADGRLYEICSAVALKLALEPGASENAFTFGLAETDLRLHVRRQSEALIIGLV